MVKDITPGVNTSGPAFLTEVNGTLVFSQDDAVNALDHFYVKLLRLPDTMQTTAGRSEGRRRAEYMDEFLRRLGSEIAPSGLKQK